MVEEFEQVNSLDEVRKVAHNISTFKAVCRELLVSWRISIKELQKAAKAFKQAQEQSEKDKNAKRRHEDGSAQKGKKKARVGLSTFEIVQDKGDAMRSITVSGGGMEWHAQNHDLFVLETPLKDLLPYVVRGVDLSFYQSEHDAVAKSFKLFTADFKTSDIRKTVARGMRRVSEQGGATDAEVNSFLMNLLLQYLPMNSIIAPGAPEGSPIRQSLGLFNFGVRMNSKHASFEKDNLCTGRLTILGTRSVAVFLLGEISDFMKKFGIVGVEAKAFVRDLKTEGIEKFLSSGGRVWHTTLGPGDFLIVPSHVIVLEDVLNNDCYGLRLAALVTRDMRSVDLFTAVASSQSTPASHISKAIAQMITASTPAAQAAPAASDSAAAACVDNPTAADQLPPLTGSDKA